MVLLTRRELYSSDNYFIGIESETDKAIERVKQAYAFSQQLGLGKLYVCFSGGKDSVAVYGVCKLAFGDELLDKCEFHYNVTGIDHPELYSFIKNEFPFVQRDMYKKSMWQLLLEKKMPPTRLMRYCCKELKEHGGEGRFCITGVRWSESVKRATNRGELEVDGKILNSDNTEDRRLLEHCTMKRKYISNPIVDWGEETVWRFIVKHDLPYCDLYDQGYDRLGCIGCPMDTRREKVLNAYPKYKEQYIRTFNKMILLRQEQGLKCTWADGEEMFNWWIAN